MGRKYIRKTSKPHAEPRVILDAVQRTLKGESLRLVAEDCGLSKSALQRFVAKHKGKEIGESLLGPNYQHAMIFTPQQEAELALYVAKCSNMFYGLTAETTRSLAYQMAVANEIKCPPSWENNKKAGIGWLRGFMERNFSLSLRQPESTSIARSTAFNHHNVEIFFENLLQVYLKTKVTPFNIYNLDETGLTTVHQPPKVIAQKGAKQVGQVVSQERGELITLCGIVSAAGTCLPPVMIFPRKKDNFNFARDTSPGTLALTHSSGSGWMNGELFF